MESVQDNNISWTGENIVLYISFFRLLVWSQIQNMQYNIIIKYIFYLWLKICTKLLQSAVFSLEETFLQWINMTPKLYFLLFKILLDIFSLNPKDCPNNTGSCIFYCLLTCIYFTAVIGNLIAYQEEKITLLHIQVLSCTCELVPTNIFGLQVIK